MGPTHPIQVRTGVLALAVLHSWIHAAAHVARVEVEAGAWVLQVQLEEQPVGETLTTKLHIRTTSTLIHNIQQGLGKDEIGLNSAGQAPLVVLDRAVAVLMQQLMERRRTALVMAD